MTEQKWSWKMIFRASAIIVLGIAQVALGALIQIKFAGLMTHVASGLMSEGISDITFAVSALWSGNNFTWSDYGRHKLMSIAITAGSIGIAAAFSLVVSSFSSMGTKRLGPPLKKVVKLWLKLKVPVLCNSRRERSSKKSQKPVARRSDRLYSLQYN